MAAMGSFLLVGSVSATDFKDTLKTAKGQTVYFNAWGGDDKINAYIAWAADTLQQRFGVKVEHVKLDDTGAAVAQILAEKAAGRAADGTIDLLWVNGENFAAMKRAGLLQDHSWATELPSWQYTDSTALPGIISDFAVSTDGKESPWGRAQLVFAYDSQYVDQPPSSAVELADYIAANPGRFTFPQPPDFIGNSFLKQLLIEVTNDRDAMSLPVEKANFDAVTAPLWDWLDAATPNLWRGGTAYPTNYPALRQLLGDGEIDIAMAFNPADASASITAGILPDTVRTYIHDGGTLANVHFLAIPFNASAPDGAKVVANFFLSPEAQIHKADSRVWGDPTVLSVDRLSPDDKSAFDALPRGVATLSEAELGATLPEPHPSWVGRLENEWQRRYGSGN